MRGDQHRVLLGSGLPRNPQVTAGGLRPPSRLARTALWLGWTTSWLRLVWATVGDSLKDPLGTGGLGRVFGGGPGLEVLLLVVLLRPSPRLRSLPIARGSGLVRPGRGVEVLLSLPPSGREEVCPGLGDVDRLLVMMSASAVGLRSCRLPLRLPMSSSLPAPDPSRRRRTDRLAPAARGRGRRRCPGLRPTDCFLGPRTCPSFRPSPAS